jgi:hypothetical protein
VDSQMPNFNHLTMLLPLGNKKTLFSYGVVLKNTYLFCNALDVKGNHMFASAINACDKHLFHLYYFGC